MNGESNSLMIYRRSKRMVKVKYVKWDMEYGIWEMEDVKNKV